MMQRVVTGLFLGMSMVLASACQPTCQSTCQRYYQPEHCDAKPQSLTLEDSLKACRNICEVALRTPGPEPLDGDNRFSGTRSSGPVASPQITNEREAAAWMDCVWSIPDDECNDKLTKQYCVQVF